MCLILVNDNNFQIKVNFLVTKYQDAAPGSTVLQEQKNMISLGYTFSIVSLIDCWGWVLLFPSPNPAAICPVFDGKIKMDSTQKL